MAKRVLQILAVIGLAAAVIVALPSAAHAQDPACEISAEYEGTATFGTSLTVVNAGDSIVFEGTGWPPDVTLTIKVNGADVGTADTDAAGNWSFTYLVPADASGAQTAEVSCGAFVLSTNFSVSTPSAPVQQTQQAAAGQDLPVTGSDSFSWIQIAVGLIALGAVLAVIARRRLEHRAVEI